MCDLKSKSPFISCDDGTGLNHENPINSSHFTGINAE